MTDSTKGPFLLIGALCENVIEAKDGRISLINVIEQITVGAKSEDPPEEMPPVPIQIKAVVAMKSGAARGRFTLRFQPEAPSGLKLPSLDMPAQFGGGATGIRNFVDLQLRLEEEGTYWIEVTLVRGRGQNQAEELLTRIPLSVMYQPEKVMTPPESQ